MIYMYNNLEARKLALRTASRSDQKPPPPKQDYQKIVYHMSGLLKSFVVARQKPGSRTYAGSYTKRKCRVSILPIVGTVSQAQAPLVQYFLIGYLDM